MKTWLTGRQIIALPFPDHCEPLVETGEELNHLFAALKKDVDAGNVKSIEFRPVNFTGTMPSQLEREDSCCLHRLDLRPNLG